MEAAASAQGGEFSRYGSDQHKQVYIYGGLERAHTVLKRSYGMQWGVGGWLLTPFLQKIGREKASNFAKESPMKSRLLLRVAILRKSH